MKRTKTTSLLGVRPVASSSRCAYFPDTCFLEISDSKELEVLMGAAVLGNTRDDLESGVESLGLIAHENVHWIQACALGSGQFLSALDQTCTQLAESFLGLLTPDVRGRLFRQRSSGIPLFRLHADGTIISEIEVGAVADRIRRHWIGLRLLRRSIDIGAGFGAWTEKLRFYFGLARLYFDVGIAVSDIALLPDEELYQRAMARAPDQVELQANPNLALSTSGISECAAVLDEHWLYAYHSEWHRRAGQLRQSDRWWEMLDRSWRNREKTFYADAFRLFGASNPHLDLNDGTVLATLGVVCHLALDGDFGYGQRWDDLYPPIRFRKLSVSVGVLGLLPAHSVTKMVPNEYHAWTNSLCEAAGLPPPTRSLAIRRDLRWFQSPADNLTLLFREGFEAASKWLTSCPSGLVCPSEAEVYLEQMLLSPELSRLDHARRAPLLILNRQMSWLHFNEEKAFALAVAGLYQRMLLELISGTGLLSRPGRPDGERGRELAKQAHITAEQRLNLELPSLVD